MRFLFISLLLLLPEYVLHAAGGNGTLEEILNMFIAPSGLLFQFVRVATAIALIVFIWGVVRMIMGMVNGGSLFDSSGKQSGTVAGKALTDGKKRMVWGLIGLFTIVSIWGIIAILVTMFGTSTTPTQPPIIVS